jgi:hypothetical protein
MQHLLLGYARLRCLVCASACPGCADGASLHACVVGLNEVGTLHLGCKSQLVRQLCTATAAAAAAAAIAEV